MGNTVVCLKPHANGKKGSHKLAAFFLLTVAPAYAEPPELGQRAVVTRLVVACPDRKDAEDFGEAMGTAQLANDKDGRIEAIHTALMAGCTTIEKGAIGLVVDISGIIVRYDRWRDEKTHAAYWLSHEAIEKAP